MMVMMVLVMLYVMQNVVQLYKVVLQPYVLSIDVGSTMHLQDDHDIDIHIDVIQTLR